jgi:hypothetical protein
MLPLAVTVVCVGYLATYARVHWELRKKRVGDVYVYRVACDLTWQSMHIVPLPKGKYATWRGGEGPEVDLLSVYSGKAAVAYQCARFFATQRAYPSEAMLTVQTSWPIICELMKRHAAFREAAADLDVAARTLQLAWRRSRERRRKKAALVIIHAALRAMYRPGGWRYNAVATHWATLAAGGS